MDQIHIGVDVAKAWRDICHPARGAKRIETTPAGVRSFAQAAAREGVRVIFEASGGHDRVLRDGLEAAQAGFSRVNPRQARDFARAMGVIGKTDRVDARMLATFGQRLHPPQTPPRLTDAAGAPRADCSASSIGCDAKAGGDQTSADDRLRFPGRHQELDPAPRAADRKA